VRFSSTIDGEILSAVVVSGSQLQLRKIPAGNDARLRSNIYGSSVIRHAIISPNPVPGDIPEHWPT
jgi:hypothetical protein